MRGVADRGVGITPPLDQDRRATDKDILPARQMGRAGELPEHIEEQLIGRRAHVLPSLALLAGAGHPHPALAVKPQPPGQRRGRPRHQPIMQILGGRTPQRAQQREEQQGLHTVDGRLPPTVRQAHGRPTQRQQAQAPHCLSASRGSAGPAFPCARWYADGGTGAMLTHGTATMGRPPGEGTSLLERSATTSPELGNALSSCNDRQLYSLRGEISLRHISDAD